MGKVIFEFDIEKDQNDIIHHQNAISYYLALHDVYTYLWYLIGKEGRTAIPVEELKEKLQEILKDGKYEDVL